MAADAERDRILLGRIAGAHGIRGEVIIHAFTEPPENIAAYGPLSDEAGARTFRIETARATAKGVVARLAGVSDRTAAEALKGVALYVDRDRAQSRTQEPKEMRANSSSWVPDISLRELRDDSCSHAGSPRSRRGTSPVRPAASATKNCLRTGMRSTRPRPKSRAERKSVE